MNTLNLFSGYSLLLTSSSVLIKNPFESTFAGVFGFSIPLIKNPNTFEPLGIKFYTSYLGYYIDYAIINISMNVPHSPKVLEVGLSSYQVGAESIYSFTLLPFNQNITIVKVFFPYSVNNPICSIDCEGGQNVALNVNNYNKTSIVFTIEGITNPGSTQPVIITVSTYYLNYLSDSGTLTITMNKTGVLFTNISVVSNIVNVFTNYSINISTSNLVPGEGYLTIQIPNGQVAQCYYLTQVPCNYALNSFNLYIFSLNFFGFLSIQI